MPALIYAKVTVEKSESSKTTVQLPVEKSRPSYIDTY